MWMRLARPPTPTSMLGCLLMGVYFAAICTSKTKRREHVLRRLFRWNDLGKTPTLSWGKRGPAKHLSFEVGVFFADTGTQKTQKKRKQICCPPEWQKPCKQHALIREEPVLLPCGRCLRCRAHGLGAAFIAQARPVASHPARGFMSPVARPPPCVSACIIENVQMVLHTPLCNGSPTVVQR